MNILLYRGGMCGDIIAAILDPTIHKKSIVSVTQEDDVVLGSAFKNTRNRLKKFWRYDLEYRIRYVNRLKSIPGDHVIISHDTNLSLEHFNLDTVQIVCSDSGMMEWFARRFESMHRAEVINEAYSCIEKNFNNFVEDYAYSLQQWQDVFVFPRQLDIKNIRKLDFVDELAGSFPQIDRGKAQKMHQTWLELNG